MLDDFASEQALAYNLFKSDIDNNFITHAYLIDENYYRFSYDFIMSFVKGILCPNHLTINNNCQDCSLCMRIDNGNYPEIKIIKPDGAFIKKEQILELQEEFSRSSLEGVKRVYIIRECDKMRPETANSMLKFLEEPNFSVVAILMTNNINRILPTIVSRCKLIKLSNCHALSENDECDNIFQCIRLLESGGKNAIVEFRDVFSKKFNVKDRTFLVNVFDRFISIYYESLRYLLNDIKDNLIYEEIIKEIIYKNNIRTINRKIKIFVEIKDSLRYNVNCNLLLDKLVLLYGGVVDDCQC